MAKIRIRILGRLRVSEGDGKEIVVSGRKPQALLAYLALNVGRPQSRDRLAGLLWGDRFDQQARQSLRQGISKLRKALGDRDGKIVNTDGEDVMLAADTDVDATRFHRLAADGSRQALVEAAALYEGDPAEGLDVREKAFEDWIGGERARYRDLAVEALANLARHQSRAGDAGGAIETAKRLAQLDPLNEEGSRLLMRLYADTGRRAQALKQYQTFAEALGRELGAEPDPETRKLQAEIQSREPSSGTEGPGQAEPAVRPPTDRPSLAVLPFANLSGDPEQEYFSDGVADDLITALSKVRSFFVIDRSSSFTFKGRTVNAREVSRALGIRYVVEGTVRKAGAKVRVTARLVEAETGNHVWADRYDGALDDIFELQDRIAASVVGAIEPQLHRAEVERIRQKRPESFGAYDLTLSGIARMNKLNPEDTAKALTLFLKAIGADRNYARAHACASWCYRRRVQLQGLVLSNDERAEAVRLAQAALKADGTDPYVLWQAGLTAGLVEGDLEGGIALIDRSLAINANANRAWLASAMLRCYLGNPETAIENAERAIRLSPLDVSMWVAYGCLANAHMQLGNYEEAIQWARKSVRLHRDHLTAHHVLAASLAQSGQANEAKAAAREILALDPDLTIAALGARYPVAGYRNVKGFLEGLRKAGLPA